MKSRLLVTTTAVMLGSGAPAMAVDVGGGSFSVNAGVTTNYLFRGVSQTDDSPSVYGGADWEHESGFSAGIWLSNVDFESDVTDGTNTATFDANYELDIYAGYDFDLGEDWSLGLNTIYYAYPDSDVSGPVSGVDEDIDYWEVGTSAGWKWFSVGIQYTVWGDVDDGAFTDKDLYYNGGFEYDLGEGFGISAALGRYDFDDADSYNHWHLALSKDAGDMGSFSFNYEQNNGDDSDDVATDDDPKLWIGWGITFE